MSGYISILGKGITSLVVLFLLSKLMGRKQVGQLNLFDYIIGITIGSIAAEMTLNDDINFFEGTFAVAIYAVISFLISILTIKSMYFRRFITGSPFLLIEKGKILYLNLKRAKMDVNDLLQEARNNGYFDLSEVEYALLEASGRISFLLKSKYNPVTPSDMKLKVSHKGLCANLVIDGVIMNENLTSIGHDEDWLLTRLKKEGYEKVESLLLVICDNKEKLTIYEKDEKDFRHTILE